MRTTLLKIFVPLIGVFLLALALTTTANAQQTPVVTTDKPDYAPRSNAVFTGSGFLPGDSVFLKVKNLSHACNTIAPDSSYLPWAVKADDSGRFVTNWTVCDCDGDSLRLKATGKTNGAIAYALFSDASNKVTQIAFHTTDQVANFTVGLPNSGTAGTNARLRIQSQNA